MGHGGGCLVIIPQVRMLESDWLISHVVLLIPHRWQNNTTWAANSGRGVMGDTIVVIGRVSTLLESLFQHALCFVNLFLKNVRYNKTNVAQ